jgi:hypothetical protein
VAVRPRQRRRSRASHPTPQRRAGAPGPLVGRASFRMPRRLPRVPMAANALEGRLGARRIGRGIDARWHGGDWVWISTATETSGVPGLSSTGGRAGVASSAWATFRPCLPPCGLRAADQLPGSTFSGHSTASGCAGEGGPKVLADRRLVSPVQRCSQRGRMASRSPRPAASRDAKAARSWRPSYRPLGAPWRASRARTTHL